MMQLGEFQGFKVALEDPGIAWITFNQPDRLNGMNVGMKRDLIETLTQAQMDNKVRVLVFTGEGRAFCAGDDLKAALSSDPADPKLVPPLPRGHEDAMSTYDGLKVYSQTIQTGIRKLNKLTIAAINGVAIQTGFSLALACDFRIAAESARVGSATLRFALLPDEGGQYLLVQHMGIARTMDFLMRKKIVSACDALDLGLVNNVVPDDELIDEARTLALELASGPQVAMRLLKQSIYNAAEMSFDASLDEIAAKTAVSDHHPDARDGVAAFREKRPPRFNKWLEEN